MKVNPLFPNIQNSSFRQEVDEAFYYVLMKKNFEK